MGHGTFWPFGGHLPFLLFLWTSLIGLFVLRFNVPVNNFSVMSGRSHRFLGFNQYSRESMYLPQGHNTVTLVGIEPRTSRFGLRRSTTKSPRSLVFDWCLWKSMHAAWIISWIWLASLHDILFRFFFPFFWNPWYRRRRHLFMTVSWATFYSNRFPIYLFH